jgi:hypothetical protein
MKFTPLLAIDFKFFIAPLPVPVRCTAKAQLEQWCAPLAIGFQGAKTFWMLQKTEGLNSTKQVLYLDCVRAGCVPLHGSGRVFEPRGPGQVEGAGQQVKHFGCLNHEGLNSTKQVLYLDSVRTGCVPLHGSGRVLEPR